MEPAAEIIFMLAHVKEGASQKRKASENRKQHTKN
jgi:hypothetical protein